jgi:hypothetical protein
MAVAASENRGIYNSPRIGVSKTIGFGNYLDQTGLAPRKLEVPNDAHDQKHEDDAAGKGSERNSSVADLEGDEEMLIGRKSESEITVDLKLS